MLEKKVFQLFKGLKYFAFLFKTIQHSICTMIVFKRHIVLIVTKRLNVHGTNNFYMINLSSFFHLVILHMFWKNLSTIFTMCTINTKRFIHVVNENTSHSNIVNHFHDKRVKMTYNEPTRLLYKRIACPFSQIVFSYE